MLFVKDIAKAAEHKEEMPADWLPSASGFRLVNAIVGEIASHANEEQRHGFYNAVGRRLADGHPAAGITHLDGLIDHVNGLWHEMGWGQATFETDDDGMDIFHHGMPLSAGDPREGLWCAAAPYILEGAYDAWFRQIGSSERLHTRILRENDGCIELRHGL